jgi:hypothetical protein
MPVRLIVRDCARKSPATAMEASTAPTQPAPLTGENDLIVAVETIPNRFVP